jgi:Rhodopirellula transposase DDE domain
VVGKKNEPSDSLKQDLEALIERYKAGSPTNPKVYWIHLKPKEIVKRLESETAHKVSKHYVKLYLNHLGYRYRKQSKQIATGYYAHREQQFQIILNLVLVISLKSPIISIDCKKKEQLGNLYRAGKCYCTAPIEVYDHDYANLGKGKVIPHGIYDLQANKGYFSIGNSAETAHFICDNLRWWWTEHGIHLYPDAKNILILCDAGGGNSYRHHCFKIHLQKLAAEIGMSLIIAHYPPYASKWNPIEHRLFCHAHQAIQGAVFSDYHTVKELFEKTATDKGLTVVVRLNLQPYQTKIKLDPNLVDKNRILFDKVIPQLSYRILP